jgi:cation diffusion facilitator CzcD-associated flavoprotein CzcO
MSPDEPSIGIIGAGPTGIACGRELLQRGLRGFTIFEAMDAPGGTWRVQSYPGLACDVWAHSYSFSYAPNPNWSANFVERAEIQGYLAQCWKDFGLEPYTRLNTCIESARWTGSHWNVTTSTGETYELDILINAMGNQHTPLYPDVPGRETFRGDSWHAARWNHDVDLTGKRVVVVGSAASAVQVVPEVAKAAKHLTVLQRSPNWIMPRNRRFYTEREKRRLQRFPILIEGIRKVQAFLMGQVEHAATLGHPRMRQFEWFAKRYLDRAIDDPVLRAKLLPDTHYQCKRGLISDDFYPALCLDHVELVASGLEEVTETGIVTADDRRIDADAIIYCTGYRILDFDRIDIRGVDGRSLADAMGTTPKAFKGIATPGFPNYFWGIGPNGLVLNVSYFRTAEQNVATIVRLIGDMKKAGIRAVEVRRDRADAYFEWMKTQFGKFSWGDPGCSSYYTNAEGHAPFLFPGNFKQWVELQNDIDLDDFVVVRAPDRESRPPGDRSAFVL